MSKEMLSEDRRVIDYLDKPPQRYNLVAARNERGVIEIPTPTGKWVKFEDMDLYMFEGGQLALQLVADHKRLTDGIKALQARCCGSDDLCNGCRALLGLLKVKP